MRGSVDTRWAGLAGIVLMLTGLLPLSVRAQERAPGALFGQVRDAETDQPVGWTQLLLEEANRSTTTDEAGRFLLTGLPMGTFTLKTFRIGYQPLVRLVTVPAGDTLRVVLSLTSSPIESGRIVVEGERTTGAILGATLALEGQALRRNLGTTIAETLNEEPGIEMRSMGPAPARPVLRGMGGERLLVLEDGGRTGDLSSTSSDHAVVIEPMTAQRIEVVRGPASLVYGSSALGGVVNVVRGYIPTAQPDRMHATFSSQVESVNRGYTTGLVVEAPAGPLALRVDGSLRRAQDIHTPAGALKNTAIETYSPSVGASLVRPKGYVGAALGYYVSEYGIPGGFVGAHPSGVTIKLDRRHYEIKGAYYPGLKALPRLEARGTYSRYFHQEFESSGSLGVEFGVLVYHGTLIARTGRIGPFSKGAIGLWSEYRDYASNGFVFTPRAVEKTVAGFVYQEIDLRPLTLQAGVRLDGRRITPHEEQASSIGLIRQRDFNGISASILGRVDLGSGFSIGASIMRSLRMPSLEELFSEGPHLAAYAYEVGDPDLDAERGWGLEVFTRHEGAPATLSLHFFANGLNDYIFPRNTGTLNTRILLPVYQTTGATVRMYGGEFSGAWHLTGFLSLEGSASYVHATLTDTDEPLPWIPPLGGKLGLRYRTGPLSVGATARGATNQDRLGVFEEGTDGYAVLDLSGQYYFSTGRFLHTLDLGVANVTDTEYRDHLSRVKSIMPEPGVNLKVLYKVYF